MGKDANNLQPIQQHTTMPISIHKKLHSGGFFFSGCSEGFGFREIMKGEVMALWVFPRQGGGFQLSELQNLWFCNSPEALSCGGYGIASVPSARLKTD
jgi:hypothetical protein